eukprot:g14510.t1
MLSNTSCLPSHYWVESHIPLFNNLSPSLCHEERHYLHNKRYSSLRPRRYNSPPGSDIRTDTSVAFNKSFNDTKRLNSVSLSLLYTTCLVHNMACEIVSSQCNYDKQYKNNTSGT